MNGLSGSFGKSTPSASDLLKSGSSTPKVVGSANGTAILSTLLTGRRKHEGTTEPIQGAGSSQSLTGTGSALPGPTSHRPIPVFDSCPTQQLSTWLGRRSFR